MLTQRNLTNKAITILQIGDSHTAADFFTGVLRRILQDRFGNGGPGYVIAGHPHIGVRSDTLKVNETAGWSYQALQKSDDRTYFALAGFNAVAGTKGMSMSFSSDSAIPSDVWEVEAVRQPGGGTINIRVDGVLRRSVDLNGPEVQPVVIRLDSSPNTRELRVTTEGKGPILISSVAAFNKLTGLTYNSVGFPGATVNVVNKFDTQLLSAELRRIRPQIVVLAFGTNEGFDDNLDLDRYARNYELVISKVQTALPKADIVIIGPPDAGRRATHCRAFPKARACSHEWLFRGSKCGWSAPPKLSGVRKVQRDIAKKNSFPYWDWAGIMPAKCGAHEWVLRSPPLMAKDHVHFSREGYRISAEAFSEVLIPMIERYMYSVNAISNNL
jgi:lysophospholipase L1-like esterase